MSNKYLEDRIRAARKEADDDLTVLVGIGPYERAAVTLLRQAEEEYADVGIGTGSNEDADRLVAMAQVYATLNVSDEITRVLDSPDDEEAA